MNWLERLLGWLGVERHEIGRLGLDRYLTRWVLWGKRYGPGAKVFLHLFHRGDAEPYCHDHPWAFWSLILWGGYWEVTPDGARRWYGPLRLLRRPAAWAHRVELPEGRRCWTLVWCGEKARSWGFLCPGRGWLAWREHEANQQAGRPGCGE
jgi:hypothetical protein